MNRATSIWLILATLSLGGAYAMRPKALPPAVFKDTGELIAEKFQDPSAAASLSVQGWNEKESKAVSFSVELRNGLWVIPSHHNYPADATERMGKAAASFIGVRKDMVLSDDAKEHAAFGLLDPTSAEGKSAEERGRRVTIKDESGTALVDVIVGKEVPNKAGFRYLRYADSNRVYGSKIELDISTSFVDWIEKDVLKMDRTQIVGFVSDSYRVDEKSGRIEGRNPLRFDLKSEEGEGKTPAELFGADFQRSKFDWATGKDVQPPAGKEFRVSVMRQLVGALSRLKIVGVRPQPKPLNPMALQSKGFFVNREGTQVYGNEGQIQAIARDGVIYSLYFGEVTYDSGLALTAGLSAKEGEGDKKEEGANNEGKTAMRYVFVFIGYQAEYDYTKDLPPLEAKDGKPAPLRGKARADALRERHSNWFYVIPNKVFTEIHKNPADFWQDKSASP